MRVFFSLFLMLLAVGLHAETLNPTEQKLKNYIIQHDAEAIRLLEQVVNINSGTTNIAGVRKVGEIFKKQFEQMGFKTYWVEMPVHLKRAGTLFAERKGKKGKRILLIGHLDTVFPKEHSFKHYTRKSNIAKGPGIMDDKGGDVVILYALKALNAAHLLEDATITVALVGDEEDSGKPTTLSRKSLIEAAKEKDIALDFEPAVSSNTAAVARRGISSFIIEAEGNDVHSSGIFNEAAGFGAIFEITRILNDMRTELSKENYLTFSPGIILGGTQYHFEQNTNTGSVMSKKNSVAKAAMVNSDLRFISQPQRAAAEATIEKIVSNHLPGTHAKVIFKDGIPAMSPSPENYQLLEQYSKVSTDLGGEPIVALDPLLKGAGDISHVAGIVPANLVGLGPVGWGGHSIDESLEVDSLSIATQRVSVLIYRLIQK